MLYQEQLVTNAKEKNKMNEIVKKEDILIPIKLKTMEALIEYVSKDIFKDGYADRATHPLEMPFLDYLIERRDKAIKEYNEKNNKNI